MASGQEERPKSEVEVFTMKSESHSDYWMAQALPVMLVVRTSEGEVRRMEVRDALKRAGWRPETCKANRL